MPNNMLQGLLEARSLSDAQIGELNALSEICGKNEELAGPLQSEPRRAVPDFETNHFLYYKDGALVGIFTLCPNDHAELRGMVHPSFRRKGIGRTLLTAATEEWRRRGEHTLLLVCENISRT